MTAAGAYAAVASHIIEGRRKPLVLQTVLNYPAIAITENNTLGSAAFGTYTEAVLPRLHICFWLTSDGRV